MYTELRRKYLPKYYHQRPNMLKFVELMSSKNSNIITKLANYSYKAFKLRKEVECVV